MIRIECSVTRVEKEGKKLVLDAKILNDAGDTLYTEVTSMFYRVDETYLDWQTMKKTIGNESGLTKEVSFDSIGVTHILSSISNSWQD